MRVVLLGTYPALQRERLAGLLGPGYEIVALPDGSDPAAVTRALAAAEVIVANAYNASLPPAPRLRLLQSPSAGMERIDLSAVPSGAEVLAAEGHEVPMAEFAICAMLDHCIGFRALASTFVDGRWEIGHWIRGPVHRELHGRTLGLLGYGGIARATAVRARALGMRIRALSRFSKGLPDDLAEAEAFLHERRSAFLDGLDYLLVTLPLEAATTGIVDAAWFAQMSAATVLINLARGPVVEEAALYDALRTGRIGGAVLDVWYNYPEADGGRVPPSRFPFHELRNVVMTPHGSGRTEGTFTRRWERIAANIAEVASKRRGMAEPG